MYCFNGDIAAGASPNMIVGVCAYSITPLVSSLNETFSLGATGKGRLIFIVSALSALISSIPLET